MRAFYGIDPGKKGAIAVLPDEGDIEIVDVPIVTIGEKDEYDLGGMVEILKGFKDRFTLIGGIEKVHAMPGEGVTSAFSMGYGLGAWRMALTALGISQQRVTPQAWKKMLMHGMAKDKGQSVLVAEQLYPAIRHLLYGPKGGVKHDRGDALLIGEFFRRQELKA